MKAPSHPWAPPATLCSSTHSLPLGLRLLWGASPGLQDRAGDRHRRGGDGDGEGTAFGRGGGRGSARERHRASLYTLLLHQPPALSITGGFAARE